MDNKAGPNPRSAALMLLDRITGEGKLLSELTGTEAIMQLAPQDRARARRLAMNCLRARDRIDRLLNPLLAKKPPEAVRNALRLGVSEIINGEARYGVVNSYVDLIGRNNRTQKFKGLVNAVLRRINTDDYGKLPVPRLPAWLRGPLIEAWGNTAVSRIEVAHFAEPPLDITLRDPDFTLPGAEKLPTGSLRLRDYGQVSTLPGFADGAWWVQDAAAALPVRMLNPQPGENVLDLCAAPGGKTMQIAAAGADVTAVDSSAVRMERLKENLTRTGLKAHLRVCDIFDITDGNRDAVLLDAPCSATGTIRRHPDLPCAKDGNEIMGLIDLQAAMIDKALGLLAPQGRLVFCTCSLLPDEGEVQIERALERHPDFVVDHSAAQLEGTQAFLRSSEGGLRLRPDHWLDLGGADGFYMACLKRKQ